MYIIGIVSSMYQPIVGGILYILVAFIWLIPDKRIEKTLRKMDD